MLENISMKKAKWHCRNSHNALTRMSASEYFDVGSPK